MGIQIQRQAAQTLPGDPEAEVKRLRGRVHTVDGRPTVFGYHPLAVSYLAGGPGHHPDP